MNNQAEKVRSFIFKIACLTALFALVSTVYSCTGRFPLVSDGRGGYSVNPMEDRVFVAGLISAFAVTFLGAFGKGAGRVLVVLLGPFLILCILWGWLGNHR